MIGIGDGLKPEVTGDIVSSGQGAHRIDPTFTPLDPV
jgi:hypothetical protein